MSGERAGPGCAIGSCLGCLMWIAIIALAMIAISGCSLTEPHPWQPVAGDIGIDIRCGTASTWRFLLDNVDLGTWQADAPEAVAQFPVTEPPTNHILGLWEQAPENVITFVVDVQRGTTVQARCG